MNPKQLEQSMNQTSSMPHFGQGMPDSAKAISQQPQLKAFGSTLGGGEFGSSTYINFFQKRQALTKTGRNRRSDTVDKISGKFNVDKRYATGNNFYSPGLSEPHSKKNMYLKKIFKLSFQKHVFSIDL